MAKTEGGGHQERGETGTQRQVVSLGRRTRIKRKKKRKEEDRDKNEAKKLSVPHYQCWEDALGLFFRPIRSGNSNLQKSKDRGGPPVAKTLPRKHTKEAEFTDICATKLREASTILQSRSCQMTSASFM